MVPPSTSIIVYERTAHAHLVRQCAAILEASILEDNLVATFRPPIDDRKRETMLDWFQETADNPVKTLIMEVGQSPSGEEEVWGYVVINCPFSETGPFRVMVEKMIVSPRHRFKGVARRVMAKGEELAVAKGRTLLILDTTKGSPAEKFYKKMGYIEFGVLPDYGLAATGALISGSFLYKDLTKADRV